MELICIPADSGLIPADSSGFRRNPVIPAGMVGGVTSTVNFFEFVTITFGHVTVDDNKLPIHVP